MRLFFLMFRIQYYIELLMYHSTNPIISGIGNLMQKIPIIQRRLKKQGRNHEQVMKELHKYSYSCSFDIRNGWNIIYSSIGMSVFFAALVVDAVMLPQLVISKPYFMLCMNNNPVLCIFLFLIAGFFLSHIFLTRNDSYIPYFKQFVKESKTKELSWHFISFITIVSVLLTFVLLTDYCFHR